MDDDVTGKLDHEWVELILEAKDMGISTEEITAFFLEQKQNNQ